MVKPTELTREHFEKWGRKGGKAKTKRKKNTSRRNGKKGGRPSGVGKRINI